MLEITSPRYVPLTTTTTTTMTSKEQAKYRFGGVRYQMQGPSGYGPAWMVPKEEGLYAFPSSDEEVTND